MIGPSVRSKLRFSAATSSARDVNGSGAAETLTDFALSAAMTGAQHDPSAQGSVSEHYAHILHSHAVAPTSLAYR